MKRLLRLIERRKLKHKDDTHVGADIDLDGKKIGKLRLGFKRKPPTTLVLDVDVKIEKPPDED